jgi:hypothetical protein
MMDDGANTGAAAVLAGCGQDSWWLDVQVTRDARSWLPDAAQREV